ncbi:MAG: HAD hydrolase family protein [Abditibacteriota bacterium]|nr:HAD hydrolase family protein [Abditibacteriota bacterium]
MIEDLSKIKVIAMDCDGTLTDGSMIFIGKDQMKFFFAHDGLGIAIALKLGFKIIWVTGSATPAIDARAIQLGITEVVDGCADKKLAIDQIVEKYKVSYEEICYIGDDLNDIPAMKVVGFPVAVANSTEEPMKCAKYITKKTGGKGAVRETIELILKAQGKWQRVIDNYEEFAFAQKKLVQ